MHKIAVKLEHPQHFGVKSNNQQAFGLKAIHKPIHKILPVPIETELIIVAY